MALDPLKQYTYLHAKCLKTIFHSVSKYKPGNVTTEVHLVATRRATSFHPPDLERELCYECDVTRVSAGQEKTLLQSAAQQCSDEGVTEVGHLPLPVVTTEVLFLDGPLFNMETTAEREEKEVEESGVGYQNTIFPSRTPRHLFDRGTKEGNMVLMWNILINTTSPPSSTTLGNWKVNLK